jgi:predicted acylesterase/phospholipase RssA
MGSVRIALTISGAVSLGAFEGGALAALITGVQATQRLARDRRDPELRIDAIGGASAGAITAVLAARAVTAGLDPVEMMAQAWVRQAGVEGLLKAGSLASPLSMDGLDELAPALLDPKGPRDPDRVQRVPLRVHLSECNLRGLNYRFRRLRSPDTSTPMRHEAGEIREPITASTYLDRDSFTVDLAEDGGMRVIGTVKGRSPVDAALASGASPLGFAPRALGIDRDRYALDAVDNLPDGCDSVWYTDGGTLENEPLGRTIDLSNEIDAEDRDPDDDARAERRRVHVLIHPFPEAAVPRSSAAWARGRPSWLRALLRAGTLLRSQSLYADFKRAEKVNSRVIWQARLQRSLDVLVGRLPSDQLASWYEELTAVLDDFDRDLARLEQREPRSAAVAQGPPDARRAARLLQEALCRVTGLTDKTLVAIDVVTPYLATGTEGIPLPDLLAGEFLFAFGGFFDERLRWSDFALGYVCMLNWMDRGLRGYGLPEEQADTAVDAALRAFFGLPQVARGRAPAKGFTGYGLGEGLRERARSLNLPATESWKPSDWGSTTLGSLTFRQRLTLWRVLGRLGRVLAHDAWLRWRGKDEP